MPELPEVETTRRGIEPHVLGVIVKAVTVRQGHLRWPVPPELERQLPGNEITSVLRRGKYLLLACAAGNVMIHLGMSGNLRIVGPDEPLRKHDHVDFILGNRSVLRFHDPRRFGCVLWVTGEPGLHPLLAQLGPEPLSEQFSADYLFRKSRNSSMAVKSFIMDSRKVVGVGNIYANEALFNAGINPMRKAGNISRARYESLVRAIKQTLDSAIRDGGTTLRDFVGSDGRPGYFKQSLNVYGRAGQACSGCGLPLKESRLGQRSTVYCTSCQT